VRGPYTLTLCPGALAWHSPIPHDRRGHADCLRAHARAGSWRRPRRRWRSSRRRSRASSRPAARSPRRRCSAWSGSACTASQSLLRRRRSTARWCARRRAPGHAWSLRAPRPTCAGLGLERAVLCCTMLCRSRMRAACAWTRAWGLAARPALLTRALAAAGAGAPGACARGHQRHARAPPHLLRCRL